MSTPEEIIKQLEAMGLDSAQIATVFDDIEQTKRPWYQRLRSKGTKPDSTLTSRSTGNKTTRCYCLEKARRTESDEQAKFEHNCGTYLKSCQLDSLPVATQFYPYPVRVCSLPSCWPKLACYPRGGAKLESYTNCNWRSEDCENWDKRHLPINSTKSQNKSNKMQTSEHIKPMTSYTTGTPM